MAVAASLSLYLFSTLRRSPARPAIRWASILTDITSSLPELIFQVPSLPPVVKRWVTNVTTVPESGPYREFLEHLACLGVEWLQAQILIFKSMFSFGLVAFSSYVVYCAMPFFSPVWWLSNPVTTGWVTVQHPIFTAIAIAPITEEIIKRAPLGQTLPILELLMRPSQDLTAGLGTCLSHYAWASCSFGWGVFLHASHNAGIAFFTYGVKSPSATLLENEHRPSLLASGASILAALCILYVTEGPRVKQWTRFVQHYYQQPWPERGLVDIPVGVEELDSKEAQVPKSTTSHAPFPVLDQLIVPDRPMTLPLEEPPKSSIYYAWAFDVPMYSPDGSDYNLFCAVHYRVLAVPPMAPLDQQAAWHRISDDLLRDLDISSIGPIVSEEHRVEWLARMDGFKKRRMLAAGVELFDAPLAVRDSRTRAIPVMVKTDEVLYRFDGQSPQLKPRLIANVPPLIQYQCGPEIWVASKRLATIWNGWHPTLTGVYVIYAAMATKELLDTAVALSLHWHSTAVLVAGDDSFVIDKDGRILEADMSMCDQSISTGPLLFSYRVYSLLGVSAETIEILWRTAHTPYRVVFLNGERVKLYRVLRPIRDTGGPDTSLGNTILVGSAWVAVLKDPWTTREELVARFAALGFNMKIRVFATVSEATFLKGVWLPDRAGKLRWGPLPSRVLKLTKSLTDFRALFPGTYAEAARKFLACQANMLAAYPAIPLLRVLVERFYDGETFHPAIERFRVEATGYDQTEVDWAPLCARYNSSPEEFLEVEAMLRSAPLPSFISHPLFERLARADYS